MPMQQFINTINFMVGNSGKCVRQPGLRVDAVEFGCLCRTLNYAEWLGRCPITLLELQALHATV